MGKDQFPVSINECYKLLVVDDSEDFEWKKR